MRRSWGGRSEQTGATGHTTAFGMDASRMNGKEMWAFWLIKMQAISINTVILYSVCIWQMEDRNGK
jgi:hypothetical protein